MDPLTMMLIGTGISGLSSIWGGMNADQTNRRNQRRQDAARNDFMGRADGMMTDGPSGLEQQMLQWLMGGGSNPFSNETFNVGQDALMQTLRAEPTSTDDLFAAWAPIEKRTLDAALGDAWSGAAGLGQRFGSATRREEGRVRGEAAENAAARRTQTATQLSEANAGRQQAAAQLLAQLGLQGGLASSQNMMGGFGQLLGSEQARMAGNRQLLQMMGAFPVNPIAASAMPQAGMDISQLMIMLPMMRQLMGQG